MSGGLLGLGGGSQAQLTNAEVITQVLASTCVNDTQADSPIFAPPTLQPNGTVFIGGTGTVETSNLTPTTIRPSLAYLNADLPSTLGNQVFWESPDIFVVPLPLAAGASRNATGNINPTVGTLTLQLGATLTDLDGNVLVTNGGSCSATAEVIE
jgi:hypothetical protein